MVLDLDQDEIFGDLRIDHLDLMLLNFASVFSCRSCREFISCKYLVDLNF